MTNLKMIDFGKREVSCEKFDIESAAKMPTLAKRRSIAYVLNWQLSKRRLGTAQTKLMSEISGTTAKPYKQKGTGSARQGSKRSVQFRGGRTCFGPRNRSFEYKIPKKIIKFALAEVLKLKILQNKVIIFDNINPAFKTSSVYEILKLNKIDRALILYKSNTDSVISLVKSSKNIKNIKAEDYKFANVYEILKYNFLILDKNLIKEIQEVIL